MIPTIIADDESHCRERLRELLNRFCLFDIIAEARDGNEALQMIITHKPEVAFLDINMPGISVFQTIPSLQNPPLIIFQTAYSEHAANAYDINAVDYLMKPLRYERLEKTVAKIVALKNSKSGSDATVSDLIIKSVDHVTITINGKTRLIPVPEIIRIALEDNYCYLYTANEKLITDKYLNHYEEKLHGKQFFRTSRTDIINLNYISMIQRDHPGSYTIVMKNGAQIELSRRKAHELKMIVDF